MLLLYTISLVVGVNLSKISLNHDKVNLHNGAVDCYYVILIWKTATCYCTVHTNQALQNNAIILLLVY